jgi:D-alanyl-D-alanine carboxypeptidase (penicillin-binding protein 5/6)
MVAAAERDGRRLIASLLNIGGNTYTTAEVLLDWGFANADKLTPVGQLPEPREAAPTFERAVVPLPGQGQAPAAPEVQQAGDAPTAPARSRSLALPSLSLPGLPSPLTVLTLLTAVLVVLRARVYWISHRSRTAWTSLDTWAASQAQSSRRRGPSDRRVRTERSQSAEEVDDLIGTPSR